MQHLLNGIARLARALLGSDLLAHVRSTTNGGRIPPQLGQLRNDPWHPKDGPRDHPGNSERHTPPCVVRLILAERHDKGWAPGPHRLTGRPYTALVNNRAASRHDQAVWRVVRYGDTGGQPLLAQHRRLLASQQQRAAAERLRGRDADSIEVSREPYGGGTEGEDDRRLTLVQEPLELRVDGQRIGRVIEREARDETLRREVGLLARELL